MKIILNKVVIVVVTFWIALLAIYFALSYYDRTMVVAATEMGKAMNICNNNELSKIIILGNSIIEVECNDGARFEIFRNDLSGRRTYPRSTNIK